MSFRLLIHGGAGAMRSMGAQAEALYREGLAQATRSGTLVLVSGGTAREAVVAAVQSMERSGAFNAGRGSALCESGHIEADAGVMDGQTLNTGAVAALPNVTNAVTVAHKLVDGSPHCVLAGAAALKWARAHVNDVECNPVPERRKLQWSAMVEEVERADGTQALVDMGGTHDLGDTVGAVALDTNGQLATAVSTGGIWLKTDGRVGDSPLIGSGFWADSRAGAACATGTGEFIMRSMLISRIAIEMEQGHSSAKSARGGLDWLKAQFGIGKAGVIAIDVNGVMTTPFDTAGMGRAWMTETMIEPMVAIWPEEPSP